MSEYILFYTPYKLLLNIQCFSKHCKLFIILAVIRVTMELFYGEEIIVRHQNVLTVVSMGTAQGIINIFFSNYLRLR